MKSQKLTLPEVEKIAKLANLTLTEKELAAVQKQLSDILSYFENLKKVDTAKTPETSQVTGLVDVMREDTVDEKRYVKKGTHFSVDAIFESFDFAQDK